MYTINYFKWFLQGFKRLTGFVCMRLAYILAFSSVFYSYLQRFYLQILIIWN